MPTPTPDAHGRFRVRRRGDDKSAHWSSWHFDPEIHEIVPGEAASDTYGAAWPETTPESVAVSDTTKEKK